MLDQEASAVNQDLGLVYHPCEASDAAVCRARRGATLPCQADRETQRDIQTDQETKRQTDRIPQTDGHGKALGYADRQTAACGEQGSGLKLADLCVPQSVKPECTNG